MVTSLSPPQFLALLGSNVAMVANFLTSAATRQATLTFSLNGYPDIFTKQCLRTLTYSLSNFWYPTHSLSTYAMTYSLSNDTRF